MTKVTRETAAGRAYLDIQNRARREKRGTQELLTLYVVERWLARLAASPYADQFILKGGMLLAALGARRPTADADTLATRIADDQASVLARVVEIAELPDPDGGVEFLGSTATARSIREDDAYPGVRVAMNAMMATAVLKFRLDVNFGDPVTPAPRTVILPPLRSELTAIRILGYPLETVLAEKVVTAVSLGPSNSRVRDYADLYTLTGGHDLASVSCRAALAATASYRGTPLVQLSAVIGDLVEVRSRTYTGYRRSLGVDGQHLPEDFARVVDAVVGFADPLLGPAGADLAWLAAERRWKAYG